MEDTLNSLNAQVGEWFVDLNWQEVIGHERATIKILEVDKESNIYTIQFELDTLDGSRPGSTTFCTGDLPVRRAEHF